VNITQTPSPNFDDRRLPISLLILHYTGMETAAAALKHMRDPQAKVSAHYMVAENGDIFQLVDEKHRAWHGGVSFWAGESDINSASIGIEIVNGGHDFGLPEYLGAQIEALTDLCKGILRRHNIPKTGVLGHSDIAPTRKQDPGEKFPWQVLAKAGIGFWPTLSASSDQPVLTAAALRQALGRIGYHVEDALPMDALIRAVQRRYRSAKIDGKIDGQTSKIIKGLVKFSEKSGSATSVG